MSDVAEARNLSTADLVAATKAPSAAPAQRTPDDAQGGDREPLAALFAPAAAEQFRSQWDRVQIGFVDAPGRRSGRPTNWWHR